MLTHKLKALFPTVFLVISLFALPGISQAADVQESTLHVTGYAQQQVSPDTATIDVGISTTAENASDARTQNNAIMQRINNAVRTLGIERTNMQTTSFNLQPNYDSKSRTIKSYTVTNTLRIKTSDFNLISPIISEAGSAGATQIYGVRFTNEHSDAIKDQLIAAAVTNGKQAARTAAAAAGISLGRVKEISINGSSPAYRENYVAAMNMRVLKEDSTPIEPGTNTMSASVDLIFYLY